MQGWITVKNQSGTVVGPGPILTASNWSQGAKVDAAGDVSFDMPTSDARSLLIDNKYQCEYYDLVGGVVTLLGTMIVEHIEDALGAPSMVSISGMDLLSELGNYSVGELEVVEQGWNYLTEDKGAVWWLRPGGSSYSATDLGPAYDGNLSTWGSTLNPTEEIYIDSYLNPGFPETATWLYVGYDGKFDKARFTFAGKFNTNAAILEAQYFNGTAWTGLTITDGTSSGGKTWAQNGTVTWTRPNDCVRYTGIEAMGNWFWVRFRTAYDPGRTATTYVRLAEVELYADQPTTTGVEIITTIAHTYNSNWAINSTHTTTATYLKYSGESVLAALITLAKSTGDHFILGTGRTINWIGPESGWSASGYRAMHGLTGIGAEVGGNTLLITNLQPVKDTAEVVTRVIAQTANNTDTTDLSLTTRTAPAGYTLNKTPTWPMQPYLENDAAVVAYGVIARVQAFDDIKVMQVSLKQHPEYASNALFDAAKVWLDTHCVAALQYKLSVTGLSAKLALANTIQVVYQEWTDGVLTIDINTYVTGALYILGITYSKDDTGALLAELEVSNVARKPESGAGAVVDTIRTVKQLTGGGGASISGSGGSGAGVTYSAGADIRIASNIIARAGNGILLYSGGSLVVTEYDFSATGLAAALAAAVTGDVVELPAGGIVADVTVPAGVTLRGLGWNSIINGMVTLGDGSSLEYLKVYQSVDTADDIIGIIGPATGEATIRDVQVALTQAGLGNALGLLSNGGLLRAYECEVWVQGGSGSAWGFAAATGGTIEINQGQVKAWV